MCRRAGSERFRASARSNAHQPERRKKARSVNCGLFGSMKRNAKSVILSVFSRPGGDLLSQVLRHSTIGAGAFDGRVRDGIGSCRSAEGHQAG